MGPLCSMVGDWMAEEKKRRRSSLAQAEDGDNIESIPMQDIKCDIPSTGNQGPHQTQITSMTTVNAVSRTNEGDQINMPDVQPSHTSSHSIPVKVGLALIVGFVAAFTVFLSLHGALHPAPLLLSLFNNMFLAGTVIFGGGPVVIPLLRNYVVDPGWVSPRDFLLGLAVIQVMPGPNFKFAIYLAPSASLDRPPPNPFLVSLVRYLISWVYSPLVFGYLSLFKVSGTDRGNEEK